MPSILSFKLANSESITRPEPGLTDVEKIPPSPRQSRWGRWVHFDLSRIPRLLLVGYATEERQRRYERQEDWVRLQEILKSKVENVVIVSGLVLGADANFLVSGDLRRMTYAAVSASMFLGLLSIIFGCFSLWSLAHPTRLKVLVRYGRLFYYLCGTASLFGSASAVTFFLAVGSWTWLDEAAAVYGWGGKISSIGLGFVLAINSGVCFFLGASTEDIPLEDLRGGESNTSRNFARDCHTRTHY